MTAAEAKKLSEKNRIDREQGNYDYAKQQIALAVASGMDSIYLNVNKNAESLLIKEGYKIDEAPVSFVSSPSVNYKNISWE